MKNKIPEILIAQDIAVYLGISRRIVYELLNLSVEAGGIRCIQIGFSKRIEKNDFLKWLEERKQ